jgi:ribosome-associated protein
MTKESRSKALLIGKVISMKKAQNLVILDVRNLASFTDYFVICSGRSIRQVRAIASHVEQTLKGAKLYPLGTEGTREGRWVLMDYGEVVIHLFYEPIRELYDLEGLWSDAPEVPPKESLKKVPEGSSG